LTVDDITPVSATNLTVGTTHTVTVTDADIDTDADADADAVTFHVHYLCFHYSKHSYDVDIAFILKYTK